MLHELLKAAQTEVDNHSIYVGAQAASYAVMCPRIRERQFKRFIICLLFISAKQ